MLRKQFLILFGFALIFTVVPHAWAAAGDTAKPRQKEAFKPTTTHIEADLWHVLKIERSEPAPPPGPVSTGVCAAKDLNWFGAISLLAFYDERQRPSTRRMSILELPIFKHLEVDHQGRFIGPPLWSSGGEYQNWYWFALLDGFVEKDYATKNALGGNSKHARLAVMDAPLLFTLFKIKFSAPRWMYWEAFDLPLSTTISHLSDTDEDVWTFLNVPLICVWKYKQKGPRIDSFLLDCPLASLYAHAKNENRDRRSYLSTIVLTLARDTREKTGSSFTLLESPVVYDAPLVFLFRTSLDQKQAPCRQYLKLPFLGPCAATWRDDGGHHFWILPKLLTKTCPEAIKTIF